MGGGGQRDGQSRGEGSGEVTEGRDGCGTVGAMKCDTSEGWEAGRGYMAFAMELGEGMSGGSGASGARRPVGGASTMRNGRMHRENDRERK